MTVQNTLRILGHYSKNVPRHIARMGRIKCLVNWTTAQVFGRWRRRPAPGVGMPLGAMFGDAIRL
jgi:hypothetical protein